ncbi:MAG TPA: PHP domain-containing protein [Nitriliruptorales bacterium]|nr:PHP domain-containing protein [Nitriliruptorales bacterium]
MPGYDLHTHTTFSDGTTTPEDNVRLALEAGLEGLGVTDHDTVASWGRARAAAHGTELEIVPGAELSAEHGGYSVHVLGYWFDPAHPQLAAEIDRLRNERERRAEEIVLRLQELGVGVTIERVRELAGAAPVGRPHIAAAVVEVGAAADAGEVFDRWLHDGGPAYVPKYAVSPERCVDLIVAAGGVAVLAHPALYGPSDGEGARTGVADDVIARMAARGLAGIEAAHPDHEPGEREHYLRLAADLGLVVTGGSDFHGDRKDLALGEVTTHRERVEALRGRRPSGGSLPRPSPSTPTRHTG